MYSLTLDRTKQFSRSDGRRRWGLTFPVRLWGKFAASSVTKMDVRYAEVTLRLSDGQENREWHALVAFTSARLRRPIVGFAGFLQFFKAVFEGDREVVELTANSLYAGT